MVKPWLAAALLVACLVPARSEESRSADPSPADLAFLQAAVDNPYRSPKLVARDGARHPGEELAFFGVTPRSTVVEIWPGGGYWTEILAPYLHQQGTYYAALEGSQPDAGESAGAEKRNAYFRDKLASDPSVYDRVILTTLGAGQTAIAPEGSADVVLTFRNLHNWMKDGSAAAKLAAMFKALKPGGILGVEEHRGQRDTIQDPRALDGYVRQDYAIKLVEAAGFAFVAASEINANPRDTADWPKGVWTLPPTFALGEQDRAKYSAIGEADNFVLKFRKPDRAP